MIGGCSDYDEEKTVYYLEKDEDRTAPYGCEALRRRANEDFVDFDPEQCACEFKATVDSKTGEPREPSPIRLFHPRYEDLIEAYEIHSAVKFQNRLDISQHSVRVVDYKCIGLSLECGLDRRGPNLGRLVAQ